MMELWDSIFKNYDWADRLQGVKPVLIRRERENEKTYIYLCLFGTSEAKALCFNIKNDILKALHSREFGGTRCEIELETLTLNVSDILWPSNLISCEDFTWLKRAKTVQIFYEDGVHEASVRVFEGGRDKVAFVEAPGHGVTTFCNRPLDNLLYPS